MGEARVGPKKRLSDRTKELMKIKDAGVPKLLDKKAESTEAPSRSGLLRSSVEAG